MRPFLPAVIVLAFLPGCSAEQPSEESNICLVDDPASADYEAWTSACLDLDGSKPLPVTCLDADPAFHLGDPVLPDGTDPHAGCVQFMNADAEGTALGSLAGCDHDIDGVNITCWCCPPDSGIHCPTGPDYSVPAGGECAPGYPICCTSGACADQTDEPGGPYACQ